MAMNSFDQALDDIIAEHRPPQHQNRSATNVFDTKPRAFQNATFVLRGFGAPKVVSWDGTTGPIPNHNNTNHHQDFSQRLGGYHNGIVTNQNQVVSYDSEQCSRDVQMTNNFVAEGRPPTWDEAREFSEDSSPFVRSQIPKLTDCDSLLRPDSPEPIDVDMPTPPPVAGWPSIYNPPPLLRPVQSRPNPPPTVRSNDDGSRDLFRVLREETAGIRRTQEAPRAAQINPPAQTVPTPMPPGPRTYPLGSITSTPVPALTRPGLQTHLGNSPLRNTMLVSTSSELQTHTANSPMPTPLPASSANTQTLSVQKDNSLSQDTLSRYHNSLGSVTESEVKATASAAPVTGAVQFAQPTVESETSSPAASIFEPESISETSDLSDAAISPIPLQDLLEFTSTYLNDDLIHAIQRQSYHQGWNLKYVLRLEEAISKAVCCADELGDKVAAQTYLLKLEEIVRARTGEYFGSSDAYIAKEEERAQKQRRRALEAGGQANIFEDKEEQVRAWRNFFLSPTPSPTEQVNIEEKADIGLDLKRDTDHEDKEQQVRAVRNFFLSPTPSSPEQVNIEEKADIGLDLKRDTDHDGEMYSPPMKKQRKRAWLEHKSDREVPAAVPKKARFLDPEVETQKYHGSKKRDYGSLMCGLGEDCVLDSKRPRDRQGHQRTERGEGRQRKHPET